MGCIQQSNIARCLLYRLDRVLKKYIMMNTLRQAKKRFRKIMVNSQIQRSVFSPITLVDFHDQWREKKTMQTKKKDVVFENYKYKRMYFLMPSIHLGSFCFPSACQIPPINGVSQYCPPLMLFIT